MAKSNRGHLHEADDVEPGMEVQATSGDLGKADVSKPRVKQIQRDHAGQVEAVVVQKGVVFRKELVVPAERIAHVEEQNEEGNAGSVVVKMSQQEAEELSAQGGERISSPVDVLGQFEEVLPTVEGLRKWERHHRRRERGQEAPGHHSWWRLLGPGFLSGMAGNDASAVGAYAIDGAQVGLAHLWLMLLATPLYQSVQYSCAKIGQVTGSGLAEVLREHYGRPLALLASLVLLVANLALMTADLVAISAGIQLLTGLSWLWFVAPVALLLWYLVVYQNFATIKRIFIVMSLVFVVYLIMAVLSHPSWRAVLFHTFVPQFNFSFAGISSAVALLGATISPYTMYWQVQSEKEEERPGDTTRVRLRFAALDVVLGAIGGNLIAYGIMLTSATTLFAHHKSIATVVDAANALAPLLGNFARYLFAIGFIGAGMVALPVLLASTSYAVAGTFGWPAALSKKPWQSEGFYLILSAVLFVSLLLAYLRIDPISLLLWANVLNGVLAPALVLLLLVVGNSRKVLRGQRLSWLTNTGLVLTLLVMGLAATLLIYGLLAGKGG